MIIILILQFLTSTAMKVLKSKNYAHNAISTTSIQQALPNKIDSIIGRLENRKVQLLHFLSHKSKYLTPNQPSSRSVNSQPNINATMLERRKKYEQKVYEQMQEKMKIKKQIDRLGQNLIQVVVQLQNNEIQLKAISKQVGDKYRQSFGIDNQGCSNSMKWIYHRILQLQQNIQNKQLKLRQILCQFFHHQNLNLRTDYRQIPTNFCFLRYVAANKLVNKLYGVILNKKQYRQNTQAYLVESEQDQDQEQDEESQQICEEVSQEQESKEESRAYVQVNDHDIWLQILKLMKKLQKMQNLDQKGIINEKISEEINEMIKDSIKIKNNSMKLKEKIRNIKEHKQELEDQLNIKHQLIEDLMKKINKLDINIEKSALGQLENHNHQNSNQQNPQRVIEQTKKQLKQIQEAIRYFSIKKNTKDIITKDTIKATIQDTEKQMKAIDSTPSLLSPHKSTMPYLSNRYLSPDLKQTRKDSQSKYSLKDLLTPPKQLSTIEKRQAWK